MKKSLRTKKNENRVGNDSRITCACRSRRACIMLYVVHRQTYYIHSYKRSPEAGRMCLECFERLIVQRIIIYIYNTRVY